jgi:hypothetical protein
VNALAVTLVMYGLVLAAVIGWLALTGRPRGPRVDAALALVQVAALALVVVDAVRTIGDLDGSDLVVHLAYLVTALIVLPVSFAVAGEDRTRWGNVALSVACLLLAVVIVRVQLTGVADA